MPKRRAVYIQPRDSGGGGRIYESAYGAYLAKERIGAVSHCERVSGSSDICDLAGMVRSGAGTPLVRDERALSRWDCGEIFDKAGAQHR